MAILMVMAAKKRLTRREGAKLPGAAAALRMDGQTFNEIAAFLDVTTTQAKLLVTDFLAETADQCKPHNRDALRRREDVRLDVLLDAAWGKALDADHPEQLPAIRVCLAIAERRAKLHGLDAPAEVVVHSPTVAEIDAWVAGVTAHARDHGVLEADIIDADVIEDTDDSYATG
jgi:hypothetical protein